MWIAIECSNEDQWIALKDQVGPPLAKFGDFANAAARTVDVAAALMAWTTGRDGLQTMKQLQAAGVPAAVALTSNEILNNEHLADRGFWQYRERAVVGLQPNPSPPYRVGKDPYPIAVPAPTLGQHNEEVLGGVLGLSEAEMTQLTERGIIGKRPRMPTKK